MRDGLARRRSLQLPINIGKNSAYTRNGLDWIKRFSVGRSGRFLSGPGEVCFWHLYMPTIRDYVCLLGLDRT